MQSRYQDVYAAWSANPEAFWREQADRIHWFRKPDRIFDEKAGVYGRWFPDAETNTCYNCLDRHVEAGRGGQKAVIYDSPMTGEKTAYTYAEVLAEVQAIAAAIARCMACGSLPSTTRGAQP